MNKRKWSPCARPRSPLGCSTASKPPASRRARAEEYQTTFDFGRAYAPVGLAPSACPDRLPEKTLRQQPFRCASDKDGITRALVVDTGEGEEAHNALVPVALGFFLREYLPAHCRAITEAESRSLASCRASARCPR